MKPITRWLLALFAALTILSVGMPAQAAGKFRPDLVMIYKPAIWLPSGFQPAGIYVRNQGNANTGRRFRVDLYLSELPMPSRTIKVDALAPGQEVLVLSLDPSLTITAVCPKAVADATNAIAESNEGNNTRFFGGIGFCG
jgi:hypothetical protein